MATPEERLENLNLTQEEMKNMTGLMKDPKFMELFADYANEISDPNNRKEMENALRDAESRGERVPGFPSDKDLLIPTAAFCAKTKNEKTGAKITMQDIGLKVTEHEVFLAVPGRYKLQLKLRYRVDGEKGQAKFDKSKHQLEVTLPICYAPPQEST